MGAETRRVLARAGGNKKSSPPIFSHEFVIQNHGDITSVMLMVVFLAFMFPMTSSVASVFIIPQYNETVNGTIPGTTTMYQYEAWRVGIRDVFTVLFYTVACVTMHAIIQEYVIDKITRKACRDYKLTLSKTKSVKLNESGQALVFNACALAHAVWILMDSMTQVSDLQKLWANYPEEHKWLSLRTKFFFIIQLAYWLHQLPEFYLQKLKADEMRARTMPIVIHVFAITAAYAMNFNRVAVLILAIESFLAIIFHTARLVHFFERKYTATQLFRMWNIVFVGGRVVETVLSIMVFWHGLKFTEAPFIDIEAGNFNTSFIRNVYFKQHRDSRDYRVNCLLVMLVLQAYLFVQFALFHFGKMRDVWSKKAKKTQASSAQKDLKKKKNFDEDDKKEN